MSFLTAYIPVLCYGTLITITAWIITSCISVILGMILGIISCRSLNYSAIARVIRAYTFVAKGIPAYVQILIVYFALPALLGIHIPAFLAGTMALAFCSSGYVTEIVRSGMNSVSQGQWDACIVLGYPLPTMLTRIIVPQAIKTMRPALFGELEQLLKSTSLLATIGITDLTRTGMNIISRELNPLPVYVTIACIYLVFSAILTLFMTRIERKEAYGNR